MDNLNPFDPEYREPERSSDEPTPTPKTRQSTGPVFHPDVVQGSDEWLALRLGLLTASEMKLILTPTLKMASNDKERAHLFELLAQRVTGYVEPHYISDDMLRGIADESRAVAKYEEKHGPVDRVGFITNNKWGFTLGYSPDGLVGKTGAVECKSRRAKYQVQTIIENVGIDRSETIPAEFLMQCQTGILVAELEWVDFVSYSGGLPMATIRVHPDERVQTAIIEAAGEFEQRIAEKLEIYRAASADLPMTERVIETEMFL